jgi:hypothetical protein
MIGITVTAEAYVAIKATLPADTKTWPTSPGHQGDVIICLDQATVDRLGAMRGPGESYSDVILRLGDDSAGNQADRRPSRQRRAPRL